MIGWGGIIWEDGGCVGQSAALAESNKGMRADWSLLLAQSAVALFSRAVIHSEVHHLGWYDTEAYGITYKVRNSKA